MVAMDDGRFQSLQIQGDKVIARQKAGGGLVKTHVAAGHIDHSFGTWSKALNGQVAYKPDDSGIVPLLLVNVLPVPPHPAGRPLLPEPPDAGGQRAR